MKRVTISIALALTIAGALVLPVAAGAQRPVRGQFFGSAIAVEQRCGPDALTLGFSVTGVTTHIGRLTAVGTNCTEFTLATQAVAIWDGIVTLEAADGSSLTTSFEGGQGLPANGLASFSHPHTIVGGTGRFEDATGEWTISGLIDFTAFTVSGTVSGWLSY